MVGSIEKQGVLLITVLCHHFQYLTNPVDHGSNILQVVGPGATSNRCVDNRWWQWNHCRIVTLFGSQVTCGVVLPKIKQEVGLGRVSLAEAQGGKYLILRLDTFWDDPGWGVIHHRLFLKSKISSGRTCFLPDVATQYPN